MFRSVLKYVFAIIIVVCDLAYAGGLLGDFVQGIGRATGVKPLEKLGQEMDNAHRDIKDAIPPYKVIEEGSSDFVRKRFLDTCNATYQSITAFVITKCSNWDGRLEDQHLIRNAVDLLVSSRLFRRDEFNGVQIRWCPLSGAHGMAPDRERVYLDTSAKSDHPDNIAALLAHEMTHIRQYRRMGTDQFKCEYSRKYVECGGCQDERHPLEREAYDFENVAYEKLDNPGWKMCNTSSDENVWVAYSHSGLREGWRKIGKGQCSVLISSIDSRYVYYFAVGSSGATWSGDTDLCVHPQNRFSIRRGETCDDPHTLRPFTEIDTGESKSWTTNLKD